MKKLLWWTPRILAILAILFMMMFSMDCFGPEYSFKEKMICFIMHNIPVYFVIICLVIAWKWELPGGILFILASITGAVYFNGFGKNWGVLPIMAPFLITGILFLVYHFLYHEKTRG
jgi:hypothetical protein